jgi:membrane peptidoglycan carboxypeptidase
MARNGYIAEDLARRCQAEPIGVVRPALAKTEAPAAVDHVLDEIRRHGGGLFTVEDLFQGRIRVRATVDQRVQRSSTRPWRTGSPATRSGTPRARGLVQGSVVVLANADAAILAEAGGRQLYNLRSSRYSDYNRVTRSLRQPGSVMKPLVYLAAFRSGLTLDATVADEPIAVPLGSAEGVKWIANYDARFKGRIPARQALAESRNAAAVWIARTSAWRGSSGPAGTWASARRSAPTSARRSARPRSPARARGRLPGHGLGAACGASRDRPGRGRRRHLLYEAPEPPGSFPGRAWR